MKNVNFDSYTDILLKTRERLTVPKNWCGDHPSGVGTDGAKCLGYTMMDIHEATGLSVEDYTEFVKETFDGLVPYVNCITLECPCIPAWNDSHTHAEVLELLDTAIAQRMQIAA